MPTATFQLAADSSCCSEARRHALDELAGVPDEIRDRAVLLTSEIVANAFLHAAGPLTLSVSSDGAVVRVEVADTGTIPPGVKSYGPESRTGRGLKMLDALAAQWGWNPSESGKTVWFELSGDGVYATGTTGGMRRPSDPVATDPYPAGVLVVLLNAPIPAMLRTGACYDALYRELYSLNLDASPSGADDAPSRLLRLRGSLNTQFLGFGRSPEETWEQAVTNGLEHVDMSFRLPREAGPATEQYGRLLDEAEEYCEAALPGVVPTDEARAVRRWAFGQVVRQCQGGQPQPWDDDGIYC